MVNKLGHKIVPSENRTRRFFGEPNLLGLKRLQGFLELLLPDNLRNRSRFGINKWYQSFALRNFDLEDMEFESANSNTTAIDEDTYSKAMLAIDGVDSEGKPQQDDKGFVDSRCSRHMTGNIAYLSYFKEFDGGYVIFGGGAYGGRISDV
ncbi:hypothetical protein Tco_0849057 [Tanacetum coccineum]